MAEIPNSGFKEVKSSGFAMGFGATNQGSDQIKKESPAPDFVAIDVGVLSILADKDSTTPRVIKSFSRKGSQRLGAEKKAATAVEASATGGAHSGERPAVSVHVAGADDSVVLPHATTTTSAGVKARKVGSSIRRSPPPPPWLDPRRVLFVFATLSSMGTLILLYFTLSMGKMSGGDVDAR